MSALWADALEGTPLSLTAVELAERFRTRLRRAAIDPKRPWLRASHIGEDL